MRNGPARSPTVAGPAASLARIDRRVGSVSAANVTVSDSTTQRLWMNPRQSMPIPPNRRKLHAWRSTPSWECANRRESPNRAHLLRFRAQHAFEFSTPTFKADARRCHRSRGRADQEWLGSPHQWPQTQQSSTIFPVMPRLLSRSCASKAFSSGKRAPMIGAIRPSLSRLNKVARSAAYIAGRASRH